MKFAVSAGSTGPITDAAEGLTPGAGATGGVHVPRSARIGLFCAIFLQVDIVASKTRSLQQRTTCNSSTHASGPTDWHHVEQGSSRLAIIFNLFIYVRLLGLHPERTRTSTLPFPVGVLPQWKRSNGCCCFSTIVQQTCQRTRPAPDNARYSTTL